MLELCNKHLRVTLLDPSVDLDYLGTRYCSAGYIFQVEDANRGELLSGPTYPESFNVFDGQGLPDAFNFPLVSSCERQDRILVLGVGICDITDSGRIIAERCKWEITQLNESIEFSTVQKFGEYHVQLKKVVSLYQRSISTKVFARNLGEEFLYLRWFPHPFFPYSDEAQLFKLSESIDFGKSDNYRLAKNGFVECKKPPGIDGLFHSLDTKFTSSLTVVQNHPLLGRVVATSDYVPAFFPIWCNEKVVSWEPHMERTISGGQCHSWCINYDF